MATETKTFYPGAYEDATGLYGDIKNPNNPVGKGSNNTTYARFGARNKTAIVYWPFDVSAIPVDATIESVACKAKSKGPIYAGTSGAMQLYSGTTPKGRSVSSPTSAGTKDITAGAWTRSELNDIRLRTSVKNPSSSTEYFDFYGADLTVTYTYQSEKFMLKTGGAWADVARVFKKVNGIWVEQTELANVIEDGVRYQNGGEIISPKKTVTITGTGDNNASTTAAECYVEINGVKYVSATTVEVDSGTTMLCYAYANLESITLNGSSVGSGAPKQYTHTVNENCTVTLSVDVWFNSKATIAITTQ